jgi:GT2 family glycosyltransferase
VITNTLVYIIVLNWNGWRDTVECVKSCGKLTYPHFRILIVDNGSTDGSDAALRELFSDVEFLQTGANLGFAGGNNAGIRYALEKGAEYVWLINNDTIVAPDALSALVCVARCNLRAGMVGSKIVYHDNPRLIWYAGAGLDPQSPWRMHHRGLREEDVGQYDSLEETGFVTGCSLLASRDMITGIGLMDEAYFLYFEDSDWSVKARMEGWRLYYSPASLVRHKVSVSLGGAASPLMKYYYSRNFLYFVKKYFPERFPGSLLYCFVEHVLVPAKKGDYAGAGSALKGITHYFKGQRGFCP